MVLVVRCSYSYLLLLLILVYNSGRSEGRYPLSKEARIRNFLLNQANFSARERPILDSDYAVHVSISMHLYGMLDLNERDQVITTASWISLRWKDERLSWNSTNFGGEDNVIMFIDEIWTPKIFVSNAVDSSSLNIVSPERGSILLTSDGSVTLGSSLVLSTQCPISLTGIPSYSERIRTINEENETKHRDTSPQEDDDSTEEKEGISSTSLEEQVSRTERRKLEARTAALVMDRLVSMTFMIVFITVCIKTVVIFKGKPEVNSDKCK